jgi:3-deoxy-D-manno-octulosonic-acid transferase
LRYDDAPKATLRDDRRGPGVTPLATAVEYLIFWIMLPFLLLHPRVRQGVRRRLGIYPELQIGPGPRVWLHGASAGDVLGLVPIVRELKILRPDVRVIVSAITDSGASMAQQRLVPQGLADLVTFLPYDLPGACRRALAALRPDVLVVEYTELWPQLIDAASRAGVKLALTNGRLRPRNVPRYRILFKLVGNLLARFDVLMMRAEEEAERALSLGAPRDRVQVTGNTKFDALAVSVPDTPDESLRAALGLGAERLWVCGSTHEGEEAALLRVFSNLRQEHPDLRLLLAPRYLERVGRVLALARSMGLGTRLRSQPGGAEPVIILDTIGELVRVYQLATMVFVGGSFGRRGGQNILEPAACGKPVLFGPRMENFADSVQVLVGRGGLQVKDPAALLKLMRELLARPDEIVKLGELAREAVSSVRGASARDARLIADLLP